MQQYKLKLREELPKIFGPNFQAQANNWLNRKHNYLRITRILTSLRLHGLEDYSKAFFEVLKQVYQTHSDKIGAKTFSFWKSAANYL